MGVQSCALPIRGHGSRGKGRLIHKGIPPAMNMTAAPRPARSQYEDFMRHVYEHGRSEEHTSELQSPCNLVCRLLLEKKKKKKYKIMNRKKIYQYDMSHDFNSIRGETTSDS